MEFEYTSAIYIDEYDLTEMVVKVKNGELFDDVFYDILSGYDDIDYYNCHLIENDVRKEIERRIDKLVPIYQRLSAEQDNSHLLGIFHFIRRLTSNSNLPNFLKKVLDFYSLMWYHIHINERSPHEKTVFSCYRR